MIQDNENEKYIHNVIISQSVTSQQVENTMTICIAAICDKGNACVISADREITLPAAALEFEHKERKIDTLTRNCVVMSSGDALFAAEVIAKTRPLISQGKDVSIQSIAEKLRDVFILTHLNRAESVFLTPKGWTLKEFKEKASQQMQQPSYQEIQNQLFTFGINVVDFLVVGIDSAGGHIFRVHYNGVVGGSWLEWCEKIGHREIGAGSLHASIFLALEGQYSGSNLAETVFNVYSAKKIAEMAPGVGSATDLAIITSNGVRFFDDPIITILERIREDAKKIKPNLSELDTALIQEQKK
jgi:hypothetical protein